MKKPETYKSPFIDALLKDISKEESVKTEKRMLLAARIDEVIKAKGWKQKDLAKALKKSPSEISKWLSGTHNFTSDSLFDLEHVLNTCLINLECVQAKEDKTYRFNISIKTSDYSKLTASGHIGSINNMNKSKASKRNFHY
jgi:transcriptional regulator with XRE-family HTH domain